MNRKIIIYVCIFLCVILMLTNFYGCAKNDSTIPSSEKMIYYTTVPQGYHQILMDFKLTITKVLSNTFETNMNSGEFVAPDESFEYEWQAMLIDSIKDFDNSAISSFGYIIEDINKDESPELFLMRKDYTILAIFTINNNVPQLLGAFWSRKKATMLSDDRLYILSSGGAQNFEYAIYELNNKNQLTKLKSFGMEDDLYYESKDNNFTNISKLQLEKLLSLYPFDMSKEWRSKEICNL